MFKRVLFFIPLLILSDRVFAVDSYRFLHVTIETPWLIFIFLLIVIMVPFILSAVLYWYYAWKKPDTASEKSDEQS